MQEKPILFSGEMVRAILHGHKTQTRRIIKQRQNTHDFIGGIGDDKNDPYNWGFEHPDVMSCFVTLPEQRCPYGSVGDKLWVREKFREICGGFIYAADFSDADQFKWKPSIHMPRTACRIVLEIINIRIERLHDISDADALAEGVDRTNTSISGYAAARFKTLWQSINGTESWEENPFVWVIEFKRVKP